MTPPRQTLDTDLPIAYEQVTGMQPPLRSNLDYEAVLLAAGDKALEEVRELAKPAVAQGHQLTLSEKKQLQLSRDLIVEEALLHSLGNGAEVS